MTTTTQEQTLVKASMYFHELFKKTVLASGAASQLTRTQMDLLMTLGMEGPLSMSVLSERVGIAPEQATRAMKGLRERGLAAAERSDENRRIVVAQLTEQGALFMDEHVRAINENLRATLEGLSPDELERLSQAASDIVALMRKTTLKHTVPDPEAKR